MSTLTIPIGLPKASSTGLHVSWSVYFMGVYTDQFTNFLQVNRVAHRLVRPDQSKER
jgi:hypothetical protein